MFICVSCNCVCVFVFVFVPVVLCMQPARGSVPVAAALPRAHIFAASPPRSWFRHQVNKTLICHRLLCRLQLGEREQMLAKKKMTCEEYREQLREWREDGGRHSDEVSSSKINQQYLNIGGNNQYFDWIRQDLTICWTFLSLLPKLMMQR